MSYIQMNNESEAIYAPSVIDFITVSAEYCVTLEKNEPIEKKEFLGKITKLLPLVYVKAAVLPEVEDDDEVMLQEYVTEDDYNFVQNRVWSILKGDDEYLEVFTQDMQFSETPVVATISENLADIYQDLKNLLYVYGDRNEECMQAALYKVEENFRNYWGQKLVNAMRPMHEVLYGEKQQEEI